jgi:glycosyltransferase involved in cell wall biosynthesis
MRIAWDITTLCMPATGIGRYTREALYATARARPDWEFVATSFAGREGTRRLRAAIGEMPENIEHRHVELPGARFLRRGLSASPVATLERLTGRVDAFVDSEWFHPRQRRGLRASIVYDLGPLLHPEWVDEKTRRFHLRTVGTLRDRADLVICISQATANDVVRELSVDPERIAIVHPGVDDAYFDARPAPPPVLGRRPYVLAVGTLTDRKNLAVLIDAFAAIAPAQPDLRLVVVGAADGAAEAVRQRIAAAGITERSTLLGYVSDDALVGIVAGASVLAFPSRFEGYGMPVTEAMAAGVPVVASSAPSIDEACGGAAFRFDPDSSAALAEALRIAIRGGHDRDRLVEAGRRFAETRRWSVAGEAFARALEDAAAASPRR